MSRYRYALFDMDGTLLESMSYWHNIVAEWTQRQGRKRLPEEERQYLENISCAKGLLYIQEKYDEKLAEKISWEGLFRLMARHYREDVALKPGAKEVVEGLWLRKIPMGILTGTPHHLADIALEKVGLKEYFDFILSPDEFPKGKGDTEIFKEGLRLLGGGDPKEVLFFEDQLYSIRTAREMGFYVVAPQDHYTRKDKEKILKLADEYWEEMKWQGICLQL